MPYDSFSNESIPKGKGIMYIKKDGSVLYFENSKTYKNMLNNKREGRKMRWTKKTFAITTDKKKVEKKESALAKDIEKKLQAQKAEKEAPKEQKK